MSENVFIRSVQKYLYHLETHQPQTIAPYLAVMAMCTRSHTTTYGQAGVGAELEHNPGIGFLAPSKVKSKLIFLDMTIVFDDTC